MRLKKHSRLDFGMGIFVLNYGLSIHHSLTVFTPNVEALREFSHLTQNLEPELLKDSLSVLDREIEKI